MLTVSVDILLAHYIPDPIKLEKEERARAREERKKAKAERLASDASVPEDEEDLLKKARKKPAGEFDEKAYWERFEKAKRRAMFSSKPYTPELPPWWPPRIEMMAQAILENVEKTRAVEGHRKMYMVLGGAMLRHGVPSEYMPEIIRRLDLATGGTELQATEKVENACHIIARYKNDEPTAGMPTLRAKWPWVAKAFREAMTLGKKKEHESSNIPDLKTVRNDLIVKMKGVAWANPGPWLFKAPPGTGKTHAICEVAIQIAHTDERRRTAMSFDKNELAAQTERHLVACGEAARRYRSPLSVMREDGTPECVLYPIGRLIQRGGQSVGSLLCEGRKKGRGQYGSDEVDPGCPHRPEVGGTCRAYGAWSQQIESDDHQIEIYNHALIRNHKDFIRGKDFIAIDEPPSILETGTISAQSIHRIFDDQNKGIMFFIRRYEKAWKPILMAMVAWIEHHRKDGDQNPFYDSRVMLEDAIKEGLELAQGEDLDKALIDALAATKLDDSKFATEYDAAIECARHSFAPPPKKEEGHKKKTEKNKGIRKEANEEEGIVVDRAPPLRRWAIRESLIRFKSNPTGAESFAKKYSDASEIYTILQDALIERVKLPAQHKATIQAFKLHEREGSTRLPGSFANITRPNLDMVDVLMLNSPVALCDANAELHGPALMRIRGWSKKEVEDRTTNLVARETALVDRSHWKLGNANRNSWFVNGRPVWTSGLIEVIDKVIAWAATPPNDFRAVLKSPLCFISYKPIEMAMKLTLRIEYDKVRREWIEIGFLEDDADDAIEKLKDPLARWPETWLLGHYGGVRGMNSMDTARTYIALGDPWLALDTVRAEAAWLGVNCMEWWEAKCIAENEQVFGRARAGCRSESMRMLYVGNMFPGGFHWKVADVRTSITDPRPRDEYKSEDLRNMREEIGISLREMATKIGISPASLSKFENGIRCIPIPVYHDVTRIYGLLK